MIANAIGTPKPRAPKIARTDSESKLAWCRAPDDGMTLLLGAPRAHARPQDERSIVPSDHGPRRLFVITQCWAVMVNKRLMGIKQGLLTAPWRARRWIVRSCAGAAHVVSAKVPKRVPRRYRRQFLPPHPGRRQGMALGATPFQRRGRRSERAAISRERGLCRIHGLLAGRFHGRLRR